jgi:hypothetical protein
MTLRDYYLWEAEGRPLPQANYPHWVCLDCALAAGGRAPTLATFHNDQCDVCKQEKAVSQPRDFGYPQFEISAECSVEESKLSPTTP